MPVIDNDDECFEPTTNRKIWRYMDIKRFVSLLERGALYFCSCAVLQREDAFEGSIPLENEKQRIENLNRGISEDGLGIMIYPEDGHIKPEDLERDHSLRSKAFSRAVYVNCWHMNNDESAAMWKIYAENGRGIAIVSSSDKLRAAVNEYDRGIFLSKIRYIDYQKDSFRQDYDLSPFVHKRRSFEHEQELRAVIKDVRDLFNVSQNYKPKIDLFIPVNLNSLIEEIRVAPQADDWFHQTVLFFAEKHDLHHLVKKSDLDTDPIF